MPNRDAARRPLLLEPLEDRALPAVAATFADSVLSVNGSPGPDTIVVRRVNNTLIVDGTNVTVPAGQVSQIRVDAAAGNDAIRLNSQDVSGQQALGVTVVVFGGDGDDTVTGTPGGDYLYGQNGNDGLTGGAGNDIIVGGNGNDRVDGGAGDDIITGDYGNDVLAGGVGNDILYGSADNDFLDGGTGDDYLNGGAGRDTFSGGDGIDRYQDDYAVPNSATGADGIVRAITSRKPGDATWSMADDVRQQIANTCALLSSLASFARTSPTDLAARIGYDPAGSNYLVPVYVNNAWRQEPVRFNGTWTDNDPFPGPAADDGSRDYWPLLYQRAYLQALNVNTSNPDANQWSVRGTRPDELPKQNWRYLDVALQAVAGAPVTARAVGGDATVGAIAVALRAGHGVVANTQTLPNLSGLVAGTGLLFGHAYTVLDVDVTGRTMTLRNPWGLDGQPAALAALSPSARALFTMGNDSDGVVRVRWDVFVRAFATYAVS
jgi:hypothetical protein